MTGTPVHLTPSASARCLELVDLVDGLVTAMAHSDTDEEGKLLAGLAEATAELAALTGAADDVDDARVITLLADVADARACSRPRTAGLLSELEQQPSSPSPDPSTCSAHHVGPWSLPPLAGSQHHGRRSSPRPERMPGP